MAAQKVVLPNLLRAWPWSRQLNKNYETAGEESRCWLLGLNLFDSKSQDAFDRCDFSRLAMLSYSFEDRAHSRTACDLMALFYAFDEYTDVEDENATRNMADILMDGLKNPEKARPLNECPLGELARQFWALGCKTASPMVKKHLIDTMQLYVDSVVQQSADRTHDRVRTIDEYWDMRRHTSGCLPSFALIGLDLEFPDEVHNHPSLERLRDLALFLIYAGNDIYSYNIERARGHALHNLLTLVMYSENLELQDAADWIGRWSDTVVAEFLHLKDHLPSWGGEIDQQVHQYVHGLARWVRGNDDWSFESQRYFGNERTEIQRTREIYMLPRVDALDARSLAHRYEIEYEKHGIAGMQIQR